MFTGIVEELGTVSKIETEGTNFHITIDSPLAEESYIDQSIAHSGVCLTVVSHTKSSYVVTAIKETLDKTNLKHWKPGTLVNLERAMLPNTRLDGHFVQGHVDKTTTCTKVEDVDGSWYYTFQLDADDAGLLVDKGSVCINGTSLTVILNEKDHSFFQVAIIPYTYEHTNFKQINPGDLVNIEFDILGKYVLRQINLRKDI